MPENKTSPVAVSGAELRSIGAGRQVVFLADESAAADVKHRSPSEPRSGALGYSKSISNQEIKSWPKESAGRILSLLVPTLNEAATIGQAESLLLKEIKNFDNINYIYILDESGLLKGVISVKELFRMPKSRAVREVMKRELITVRPSTDRERVAMLAIKHNLKNLPVTDKAGRFLGAVLSDTILAALHEEGVEDALRSGGILRHNSVKEFLEASAAAHFRKRLPWLLAGLLGGLVSAIIIGFFEDVLSEFFILAAFIPAVVYMADAVGSQTEIIFIKNLALDQRLKFWSYFKKEILVSFLLALVLGLLISFLSFWWFESLTVGLILGLSFPLTILAAAFIGIILPWCLFKIKVDPALPAGPFSTIVRDVLSIVIYFAVASAALGLMP